MIFDRYGIVSFDKSGFPDRFPSKLLRHGLYLKR